MTMIDPSKGSRGLLRPAGKLWPTVIGIMVVCTNLTAQELEGSGDAIFSEAETRLWLTDQLGSVSHAMELTYRFEKSGSLEAGFSDRVRFVIEKVNGDGTKAASLEFFTGERNFPVPSVDSTTVNPVIKVYLQGDVYEMNRLTDSDGGARERWRYFQRRIKFALAESATVEPKTFSFDGREWHGFEIRFQPYVNDPKRALFERLSGKSYSFIVCDELPGYLYRIETEVPGEDGARPLLHEVLELSVIQPAG
jgi:hypothetical protein